MEGIKLDFDFSEMNELAQLFDHFALLNKNVMPNTSKSVTAAAQYVQSVWSDYLAGGELNGIEVLDKPINPKNARLRIDNKGDFASDVVSDSRQVIDIQQGTQPVYYDMKQTHPYGNKSRVNKDGIPYLIIPFRWGTPGNNGSNRRWNNTIPQINYDTAVKDLKLSQTNEAKNYISKNAKGNNVERAGYDWAKFGRLTKDKAWNDNSVGMVRMKDTNSKSTYFTFRIISAKSPMGSWLYWKDGKDARDMLGALKNTVQERVSDIIETGIRKDLGM